MDVSAIVNALHLLSAVIWIGGMAFVILTLEPSLVSLEPVERGKLMGVVGRRFSIISWVAVILLLATGFAKTPDGLLFDASEGYGAILLAKHITVLLMILIGLRISLGLVPRIRREAPQAGPKEFGWSFMAGWYAERGCEGFYRTIWEDPAVANELEDRLRKAGAWRVAEALTQ